MLAYFQAGMTGYIQNVPVCADYCDAWFEACKAKMTSPVSKTGYVTSLKMPMELIFVQ